MDTTAPERTAPEAPSPVAGEGERNPVHVREHLEDLPEVRDRRLLRTPAHRPPAPGPGRGGSPGVR